MSKYKKKSQIVMTGLLLVNLLMAFNAKTASAQVSTKTYGGVQGQIEAFLCAPSDAKTNPEAAKGDLYNCINKVYRFTLVLASVFAVFMIVIAGYLYMAAEGNEESVTKAKDILVTSIASLVILFSGYILLKFLNPDLIKFQPIQPKSIVGQNRAYSFENLTDAQVKAFLGQNGVSVAPGATLTGLAQSVQNEISNLRKNCANCEIQVTSSTGGTHAPGECSHASGNKVDIRPNSSLDAYILKFSRPSTSVRSDGAPLYVSPSGGIYADERSKPVKSTTWTGAHWDIAVCN